MEYIVINESKLKIICQKCDLDPYGISADSLEYGDASSRKFLEGLLEEAKTKFGFETAKHRVLIQLYPDSEGGCEIFVSRLGAIKKNGNPAENKQSERKIAENKPIQKIFYFEKLDFLLEACKRLSFFPTQKNSSAFYIAPQEYYLYFESETEETPEEYGIPFLNEFSFLYEYGEAQDVKEKLPFLNEYANIICKNTAIETLGRI